MDALPARLESVFRVAVENITPLWPQLEPLLEKPLTMRPTHDTEDVRKLLMGQVCHLWVQMDGSILEAFVITEFSAYPKGVWLNAWLAAARDDARFDYWRFRDVLCDWAISHQCRGVSAIGRVGWLKKYPEARYEGVCVRMTFQ